MGKRDRQQIRSAGWFAIRRPSLSLLILYGIAAAGVFMIGKGLFIQAKAALAQVLLETSFQSGNMESHELRPWPWADFTIRAKLSVPRLGTSDIVLSDAGGEALAFGPTHLAGTPNPGEQGTAVIAAHRDTHFRWLRHIQPGDEIRLIRSGMEPVTFRVSSARIALSQQSGIDPHRMGYWLALTTCWPFDSQAQGPLRYIVEAERTDTQKTVSASAAINRQNDERKSGLTPL